MTAQCTLTLWTLKTYLFKQREELRILRLGISKVLTNAVIEDSLSKDFAEIQCLL